MLQLKNITFTVTASDSGTQPPSEQTIINIVVSHNKAFLEAADTLLLIKKGKIAYTGDLAGAMPMYQSINLTEKRRKENGQICLQPLRLCV